MFNFIDDPTPFATTAEIRKFLEGMKEMKDQDDPFIQRSIATAEGYLRERRLGLVGSRGQSIDLPKEPKSGREKRRS